MERNDWILTSREFTENSSAAFVSEGPLCKKKTLKKKKRKKISGLKKMLGKDISVQTYV